MIELVVEYRKCLVFLLIYKIFKRGFLHDSKRADTYHPTVLGGCSCASSYITVTPKVYGNLVHLIH